MSKLITHIKRLALALCLATPIVSWAATSTYSTYKDDTDTPRSGAYGNANFQRFKLNATWMFNIDGTDIASTADAVSLDSIKVYWHSGSHGNADIGHGSNEPDPYLVVTTPQKVIVGISAVGEKWSASGSSTFAFTDLTISPNAQYYYYFATNVSGLEVGGVLSGNGAQARFTGTWHGSANTSDTTVCVMDDGRYSIRCDFAVSEATSTVLTTTTEGVSLTTGTDPVFVKGAVADGVVNVDSEVEIPSLTVVGEATTLKLADTLTATYLYLPATTTIDASSFKIGLPGSGEGTKETVLVVGKIAAGSAPTVTLPDLAEGYSYEPLVRDDSGIKAVVSRPVDATVTFTSGGQEIKWSEVKPEGWVDSAVPTITIDNANFAGTLVFDEDVQAAKIIIPGAWSVNIKRNSGVSVSIPQFTASAYYMTHTFTDFEAIPATTHATETGDALSVVGTETLTSIPQISTANQQVTLTIAQKATLSGTGDGGGFYVRGTKSVNINSGADISATRFVLGNDGSTTQTVTQNGGAVTVTGTAAPTSNQASILLGHWNSTATLKTLGGTFTANNVASRLGWDGTATWQIGGGSSEARVNVYGIVNGGNGHSGAGTLNIMDNGTLNLGAGGVDFNNGNNGGNINLAGGTISAGADAVTITNAKDGGTIINQGKVTTINVGGARTLTVNAVLSGQGVGTLTKTGTGTMILAKTATTKGKLLVSEGTVKFNEGISWGSNGTVEVGANGTLDVLTAEAVAEGALLVAGSYTVNGTVLNNGSAIDVDVKNDGIYRAIPTVTVTVPAVDNTTVTVVVGDETIGTAAGNYDVAPGSVVTVTYAAADGYKITGTTEYTINTANSETTFTPSAQVALIVAYIGEAPYTDLATAFSAVDDDDTLTLVGTAVTLATDVTVAKSYTLAGDAEGTTVTGNGRFLLNGSAELTLGATVTVSSQIKWESADATVTFPTGSGPALTRPMSGYLVYTRDNQDGTSTYYLEQSYWLYVGASNVTLTDYDSGAQLAMRMVVEGDVITFTATPAEGYGNVVVTANSEALTPVDGKYTVTVGAGNVSIQATAVEMRVITVPSVANATATAKIGDATVALDANGQASVPAGSEVKVTYAANEGYALSGQTEYTIDTATATTFVITDTATTKYVASITIGEATTKYTSLQAAVDEVAQNKDIVLLDNVADGATVSREVTFSIVPGGYTYGDIVADGDYILTTTALEGKTRYTFAQAVIAVTINEIRTLYTMMTANTGIEAANAGPLGTTIEVLSGDPATYVDYLPMFDLNTDTGVFTKVANPVAAVYQGVIQQQVYRTLAAAIEAATGTQTVKLLQAVTDKLVLKKAVTIDVGETTSFGAGIDIQVAGGYVIGDEMSFLGDTTWIVQTISGAAPGRRVKYGYGERRTVKMDYLSGDGNVVVTTGDLVRRVPDDEAADMGGPLGVYFYVKDGADLSFTVTPYGSRLVSSATIKVGEAEAVDLPAPVGNVYTAAVSGDSVVNVTFAMAQAQIGTTLYPTLAEALAAATDGQTVTLVSNVALTERLFVNAGAEPAFAGSGRYATTTENKAITLDLNNFNITTTHGIALAGGSLTVTGTGKITCTDVAWAPIEIRGTGDLTSKRTLTIGQNVTLEGTCYGLNVFGSNNATKNKIDVTVNGTVKGMLFVLGNLRNQENEINIVVNGTVDASEATGGENVHSGIAVQGHANVTVGSTAIVKGESGIEIRDGSLSVAMNASITGTVATYSYNPTGNGATIKGAAIAVAQYDANRTIDVQIETGASLSATKAVAVVDVNNDMSKVGIKVPVSAIWGSEIPAGYKWVEAEEVGYYTLASAGIDPTDPTSAQEVAVDPAGKTQAEIEEAAIAAASVKIPEAVVAAATGVTEATYKTYFNYTVTQSATYGKYEVKVDPVNDLKEEVVLPASATVEQKTITQAEEVLEAVTTDATNATVPAVAGIYYSLVAADNLNFTEAVEGAQTLATGSTVTIAKPTQLPSGTAVFFRVKASATPNTNN